MSDRICKAIVSGVAALLLVAPAVAAAEPIGAHSSDGPGWQSGGRTSPGATAGEAPRGLAAGASAPFLGDPYWSDTCWQVRPIYSISGAWLDNRRVNVCY